MPWYAGSDTAGVLTLNGVSGAVTLAVVGGSIATAGSTITITIAPGVTSWADLSGKPSTFPPSAHGHIVADVTGLQAALDGKQAAGSYAAAVHTHTVSDVSGLGTLATQNGTFSGTSSGTNTGDQTISLTGDVTGSGTGTFAATLSASGVTAGTYTSVTVDAKGRVTAGSSPAVAYSSLTGVPSTFAPSSHSHGSITDDGKIGNLDGSILATGTDGVIETLTIGGGLSRSGGALITDLAAVASTGSYGDLTNKPTIPTITSGTAIPTGGIDGDIYLQHPG